VELCESRLDSAFASSFILTDASLPLLFAALFVLCEISLYPIFSSTSLLTIFPCQSSAVMEQWKDEVKKKTTKGFLKVTTHHGPGRFDGEPQKFLFFLFIHLITLSSIPSDAHDLEKYDVIVSSPFPSLLFSFLSCLFRDPDPLISSHLFPFL